MIKLKEVLRSIGLIIMSMCAVTISTVFLNYNCDLRKLDTAALGEVQQTIFDGQVTMSNITVAAAGGILGIVALLMLLFTVIKYIDNNQASMGILKAMGYRNSAIAANFGKFGLPVAAGCALGFGAGIFIDIFVYSIFNDGNLPEVVLSFNFPVFLFLVIIPSVVFTLFSAFFAYIRLRKPPLDMIRNAKKIKVNRLTARLQRGNNGKGFLQSLKRTMLSNNILLVFFVGFAAFGFSSMFQMAFTMNSVEMDFFFSALVFVIGLILGAVTLVLTFKFIFERNAEYIAIMKAYGYTGRETGGALFGGYRIVSYIGFAVGSVYQYFLMVLMVSLFAGAYDVEIRFSFIGLVIAVAVFAVSYELLMLYYKYKIGRSTLKSIMKA